MNSQVHLWANEFMGDFVNEWMSSWVVIINKKIWMISWMTKCRGDYVNKCTQAWLRKWINEVKGEEKDLGIFKGSVTTPAGSGLPPTKTVPLRLASWSSTCICVHTHTRTHARTCTYMHVHTHMHTHKHTHMHIHACTHTCTHAHTHTLTQSPSTLWVSPSLCWFLIHLQQIDDLEDKKRLCFQIEEVGGFEKIESLQHHQNSYISHSALNIIEKYL